MPLNFKSGRCLVALALALLIQSFSNAQELEFSTVDIGQNFESSTPISSILIETDQELINYHHLGSNSNKIMLFLGTRNKKGRLNTYGTITLVDFKLKKVIWQFEVDWNKDQPSYNNGIFYKKHDITKYAFNAYNGEILVELSDNQNLILRDSINKIDIISSLTYEVKKYSEGTFKYVRQLRGENYETKELIWKSHHYVRLEDDVEIYRIDKENILFKESGMRMINLNSGPIWNLEMFFTRKLYRQTNEWNVSDLLFSGSLILSPLAAGAYNQISGAYNKEVVSELKSNLLMEDDIFFQAGRKLLVAYSTDSVRLWKNELVDEYASKSELFIEGDTLYLLNLGGALNGSFTMEFGKPYISAYNKYNGEEYFFSKLTSRVRDPINSYEIKKDNMYCVFNKRISKTSLTNGQEIFNVEIDTSKYGIPLKFIGSEDYWMIGDNFEAINDTISILIKTSKDVILHVNAENGSIEKTTQHTLGFKFSETDNYELIYSDKLVHLQNAEHLRVNEFEMGSRLIRKENLLFFVRNGGLFILDLSQFE